ncbi:hypothetical protein CAPTEDRAFT_195135 [Capitella teleta]|uniref:Uncharacterized protein n=1 Tax=Capitella teleta TaxID=283909 RepID=R7VE48_CAPTE|nr:hypothetical protein CAPTEDRAFT_195135 [Capitella teleta]|eukprot:ELU16904.1 hypothetical protein CAPTEDRAFT_195135 [Capitella teleta]
MDAVEGERFWAIGDGGNTVMKKQMKKEDRFGLGGSQVIIKQVEKTGPTGQRRVPPKHSAHCNHPWPLFWHGPKLGPHPDAAVHQFKTPFKIASKRQKEITTLAARNSIVFVANLIECVVIIDIINIDVTDITVTIVINDIIADYTFADDTFAGDTFAGDTFVDDTFAGDTFAGDTFVDDTFAGDTFAGDTFADDTFAGDTFAGDTFAERTTCRGGELRPRECKIEGIEIETGDYARRCKRQAAKTYMVRFKKSRMEARWREGEGSRIMEEVTRKKTELISRLMKGRKSGLIGGLHDPCPLTFDCGMASLFSSMTFLAAHR